MLPVSFIKKAIQHERYDFVATALEHGWLTDGHLLIKLPAKELKRLNFKNKKEPGVPANVPKCIEGYAVRTWSPTTKTDTGFTTEELSGFVQPDAKGKHHLTTFDRCPCPFPTVQIEYIESLYPEVKWARTGRSQDKKAIAGFIKGNIIALVMPVILVESKHENKNTRHRHAPDAKKVKRGGNTGRGTTSKAKGKKVHSAKVRRS